MALRLSVRPGTFRVYITITILSVNYVFKTAFKRTVFTNKRDALTTPKTKRCIIGLSKNSFGSVRSDSDSRVESMILDVIDDPVSVISKSTVNGKATIADADIVVSAGRGLKGPENWHLIEELADVLCYALAMANELGLDISQTVQAKMVRNAKKYPVEKIKGRYGHDDPGS